MKSTEQTRITLTGVHYAAFASEETSCFEATINFDGKPVCTVSNDGHGGADLHRPLKGENYAQMAERLKPVNAFIATLEPYKAFGHEGAETLETVVGDCLTTWLYDRDFKRALKTKLLYTRSDEQGIFYAKVAPKDHARALESWRNKRPHVTYTPLNSMPYAEAFAIYAADQRRQAEGVTQ